MFEEKSDVPSFLSGSYLSAQSSNNPQGLMFKDTSVDNLNYDLENL